MKKILWRLIAAILAFLVGLAAFYAAFFWRGFEPFWLIMGLVFMTIAWLKARK